MGRIEIRGRNRNNRKRKSIVAIKCEGKNKTERTYLKNYSTRECILKFSTGNATDPVGMAEDLIRFIKNEDISSEYGDKIYLLLDTDVNQNKQQQIEDAKNICDKNNIELILSIPTFEIWYILHFDYTTKIYQSSQEVKQDVKVKIENYTESMEVFPLLKNKTLKAIENSKKLEKYQSENGKNLFSENCIPYSGVYKVIEELMERNKKQT